MKRIKEASFLKYPCCGNELHHIAHFELKDLLDDYSVIYHPIVINTIKCLQYNKLLTSTQAFEYVRLIGKLRRMPKTVYDDLSKFFDIKFHQCLNCKKVWLRKNLTVVDRNIDVYTCEKYGNNKVLDIQENAASNNRLMCNKCDYMFEKEK